MNLIQADWEVQRQNCRTTASRGASAIRDWRPGKDCASACRSLTTSCPLLTRHGCGTPSRLANSFSSRRLRAALAGADLGRERRQRRGHQLICRSKSTFESHHRDRGSRVETLHATASAMPVRSAMTLGVSRHQAEAADFLIVGEQYGAASSWPRSMTVTCRRSLPG